MTVDRVVQLGIIGLIGLEYLVYRTLRWQGYFQSLPCHRCGQVHTPPWYYRAPHGPQRDWDVLARQCHAVNLAGGRA